MSRTFGTYQAEIMSYALPQQKAVRLPGDHVPRATLRGHNAYFSFPFASSHRASISSRDIPERLFPASADFISI